MAEDDLEPLITECPNCATRFRVTEAQLQVASGRVRCGSCLTVFHGVDHLVWDSAPEFSSEDEASSALEELLSELEDAPAPTHPGALPHTRWPRLQDAKQRGAGPWEDEESRLYVGYEESPESDRSGELEGGHSEASPASSADAPEASEPATFDPDAADVLADDTAAEIRDEEVPSVQAPETGPPEAVETPAPFPAVATEQSHEHPEDVPAAQEQAAADVAEHDEAGTADRDAAAVPADAAAALTPAPAAALEIAAPGEGESPVSEVSFAPEPRRWWVGVAAAVGVLALAAQIFWYQFESWGRDPTLRPVYASVCRLLGCELPVLQDLKALRTEKLLVRSHPDLANALIVDAVIVNEADFAQPFPALELRFTTIDGNLVAGRRFKPDEYLAGELRGATLMPPKTPVRLELAIDDPGGDAVNYFLTFRSLAGGP
jgi:predicted Zn finger-like uncharacterized protein